MKQMTRLLCVILLLWMTAGAAEETVQTFHELCGKTKLTETDACAWLEIPGAGLLLPVMQHDTDDAFYLTHDHAGKEAKTGALYTEHAYSAKDFSDPVTVIYGRRSSDGSMFGSLQEWYSGSFEENRLIRLYLPEETREYTVFAALPYSAVHLLHYNDFRYDRIYRSFFEEVYSTRRISCQLDETAAPEPGEQVIILSTSLMGDSTQRYLVMAKLNSLETN